MVSNLAFSSPIEDIHIFNICISFKCTTRLIKTIFSTLFPVDILHYTNFWSLCWKLYLDFGLLDHQPCIDRHAGVRRHSLYRPRRQASPCIHSDAVGEIETQRPLRPSEEEHGGVMGHRCSLWGGVWSEPEAFMAPRHADFRHPFPPFPTTYPLVLPLTGGGRAFLRSAHVDRNPAGGWCVRLVWVFFCVLS